MATFALADARAVGARAVRVTFTIAPLYVSPIAAGDAGNLSNWELSRDDTGRAVPLLGTRSVEGGALSVELLMAEPFASSPLLTYTVAGSGLLAATGESLSAPTSLGLAAMPDVRLEVATTAQLVDVFNPQNSGTRLNGALQVGTDGDYVLESGPTLIKKLVVRRLLTAVDEFYHLAGSGYGAGLQPKLLLRPSDLVVLRARLEAQVLQEAEVASATVTLTLQRSGELDVTTALVLKNSGQQLSVQFPLNPIGGSQV